MKGKGRESRVRKVDQCDIIKKNLQATSFLECRNRKREKNAEKEG